MMFRVALIAALALTPTLAAAQQAATGQPPQRIRNVQLAPGQACPKGSATEVVVCSTLEEPYRIPKQFRDDGPIPAQNQSWVNRAATADQTSRVAAGLPDTCSPIGTGGQSGCALQRNQQWAAEKRAERSEASRAP